MVPLALPGRWHICPWRIRWQRYLPSYLLPLNGVSIFSLSPSFSIYLSLYLSLSLSLSLSPPLSLPLSLSLYLSLSLLLSFYLSIHLLRCHSLSFSISFSFHLYLYHMRTQTRVMRSHYTCTHCWIHQHCATILHVLYHKQT